MDQPLSFTSVIESAAKLPFVHVGREEFLTKNLGKLCTEKQLQKAIEEGTLHADIPISTLDSLANAVIHAETIKVTAISTAAGLPGGFAMAATIPADLAQFYGFVICTAQELAYIYGWNEIFAESSELDANTESQLILFIGVMSGVGAANTAVAKLFGETAMNAVAKRVAAKALTKTWYYPIVKKIAAMLGQKMVKATFAKGVSKAVPVLGGAISGALRWQRLSRWHTGSGSISQQWLICRRKSLPNTKPLLSLMRKTQTQMTGLLSQDLRRLRQTVGYVLAVRRIKANSALTVAKQSPPGYRNTNVTSAVGNRMIRLTHRSSVRSVATRLMKAM